MTLNADLKRRLLRVSTATISTALLKKGVRNVFLRGPKPLQPRPQRFVGQAFTLRFVPAREDVATIESWSSPRSTRAAVETMPEGCIVVADAMGIEDAGIFGDILCSRMVKRGVTALVADGVIRDICGIRETGLPVWCRGTAPPPSIFGLTFAGWQECIGCGGVAVFPGDIIVTDADGAVVIPEALADLVADFGEEAERLENWILDEVKRGCPLPGLYPPNEENRQRYQEYLKKAPCQ
jgi:regulator of RNase E activity RraA